MECSETIGQHILVRCSVPCWNVIGSDRFAFSGLVCGAGMKESYWTLDFKGHNGTDWNRTYSTEKEAIAAQDKLVDEGVDSQLSYVELRYIRTEICFKYGKKQLDKNFLEAK